MSKPDIDLNRPTPEEYQQISEMIAADVDDYEASADDFAQFQPLAKMGRPKAMKFPMLALTQITARR